MVVSGDEPYVANRFEGHSIPVVFDFDCCFR